MKVTDCVGCTEFLCVDVRPECYLMPNIEINLKATSIVLISEAVPANPGDYYYAEGNALFEQTTVQAFQDAGAEVESIRDILAMGVYLTTAVKCGKTGYGIRAGTIEACSRILEGELAQFPAAQVYLLMGDVAIKSLNYIAKRQGRGRVIPAGSTYKIRGEAYCYKGVRVFPSYLQAGPSFFIERSKRRMIAEDIATALELVR